MSDGFRKALGAAAILLAVLLECLPLIGARRRSFIRYQTALDQETWVLTEIKPQSGGSVRINSAGQDELETLPGIGPAYAGRILDERTKNGPFFYPEDLEAVSGIGPRKAEDLSVMINLTVEEDGK